MKLVAATLLALAPLLLLPAAAEAGPRKEKRAYDPDGMICVVRAVTGSRLQRVRQCHAAREWGRCGCRRRSV